MPRLFMILVVMGAALALAGAINAALVTWLSASGRGPLVVWTITAVAVVITIATWWALYEKRRR